MEKVERIRPGVKAFIVHQGKILIVKEKVREENKEVIIYDVPGGGIELGESVEETLHREVFEEVGLKIRIHKPVGCWDFVVRNPEGNVHIVCLCYQCSIEGDPTIDVHSNPAQEDIFEAVWMTKDELLATDKFIDIADMRLTLENVQV